MQNVDRVWFKTVDDDAFVPLYFHDKLRAIRQGTAIEVRQVGEFELQFHGGSRIVAQGETALALTELTEAAVAIDVRALTHLRLEAFGREHRIALPDGSTLVVAPDARPKLDEAEAAPVAPPAAVEALAAVAGGVTPFQAALLVIERVDEPGWRAGRATVWNGGDLAVEWRHAFGTTTIAGGQRVTVLLTPPTAPIAGGFRSEGVDVRSEGPAVSCRADGDGLVSWSGARFRLQNGAVLRLDPLQGEPFAKAPEPTEQGR